MVTRRGVLASGAAALVAGAAPRIAWARTEADVAILGAGLAGLAAARLLEAAGARVAIVEGEGRVGGRLHTLRHLPGAPEAGGIQVGAGYAILRRIAAETGVALSDGSGAGAGVAQLPGNLYHVNGIGAASSGWADSPGNRLEVAERTIEPASLARLYAGAVPTLASPSAWLDADPALDISWGSALRAAGASAEAQRLLEANLNGNTLEGMSQLHVARTLAIYRSQPGPISTIVGGSQALPEAMAATLAAAPRLGVRVTGISEEADGVTIATDRGTIRARQAICTIPFAALREVPLKCAMPAPLAHMIAALPYTRASFAYIAARTAFWQSDCMPETLWTDDPLIGRVFALSDGTDGGVPMLKLWTTGSGADQLDRMPPETARAEITRRIVAMRPSASGQLGATTLFSWQASPFARGIYHHIGTGMAGALAAATRHEGTRLHFAGEHLAQASSGMEAALESGERVARHILGRL